jgi:hypothetical protein
MRTPFSLLISSNIVFGFQAEPIAKCPPSSIPSSTQYVTLQKKFSLSSLVFESGTANSLETTNSKPPRSSLWLANWKQGAPMGSFLLKFSLKGENILQIAGRLLTANHLDQSLWLANCKQGPAIRSFFIMLFFQRWKHIGQKPSCRAKPAWFDFSSSTF